LLTWSKKLPGANATVYLASAPQLADVCGGYFYDSRQIEPSPVAQDDSTAQRLWQESETIQMAVATRLILHLSRSCSAYPLVASRSRMMASEAGAMVLRRCGASKTAIVYGEGPGPPWMNDPASRPPCRRAGGRRGGRAEAASILMR
jgi:hypothetical protein